ncbi:MAG: hypothetical protein M5R36_19495 [Deltaproteobacteria bacterium]|nr:hypothetical protein [Deltaproteobacteria bacterium]
MNGALRERFDAVDGWLRRIAERVDDALSRIPRRWWETGAMVSFAVLLAFLASKSFIYAFAALVVLGAAVLVISRPDLMTYMLVVMIPVVWINLLGKRLRVMTFFNRRIARVHRNAGDSPADKAPVRADLRRGIRLSRVLFSLAVQFRRSIVFRGGDEILYFRAALRPRSDYVGQGRPAGQSDCDHSSGLGRHQFRAVRRAERYFPVFYPAYHLDVFGMDIVSSYSVGQVRRASGTFESGPRLAMFLLLTFAFAMTYYFRGVDRRTPVWAALIAVIALGLFVSFTRIAVVLGAALFLRLPVI